ncbi:hypothetical protein MBLNU230_g7534t1 [Neophaeotheca triangularis]
MKPFRPPTLVGKPKANAAAPTPQHSSEPPPKKRRISEDPDDSDHIEAVYAAANLVKQPKAKPAKTFRPHPPRKPLDQVHNPSSEKSSQTSTGAGGFEGYFTVLWRKFTTKKNKTWDGDGVLSVSGGNATLQDISGRSMGRTACKGPLMVGSELSVGGKDVEIEAMIPKADFLAGRPFLGNMKSAPLTLQETDPEAKSTIKQRERHDKLASTQKERLVPTVATSKATKSAFRTPLLNNTVQTATKDAKVPIPRHNPNAENALVMKRPASVSKGKRLVDVVVDPMLTKNLREHQRAGVAFMYECVMGMKDYDGEGAILADEMGLGKTLQTIALLWTLLKQSPIYEDAPVIKKALIVCPVTLINNWKKEFRKWLGNERVGVFVAENTKTRLTDFTMGKAYSVMIVGYEKLRTIQGDLQKGSGIDIVIADEGHRLKTAQNKSAMAIKSLNTERRVILSGTPIQNDLAEFWTMVDFVNPGLLNKYTTFRREFETPILKSRQPGTSQKEIEKGEARSEELASITGMFILRRTAEILSKYLPPKTEYVVFCRPTKAQATVYRGIVETPTFSAALSAGSLTLELINVLKKVCNSPNLLLKKGDKGEETTKPGLLEGLPNALLKSPGASGKLQVLDSLLHLIRTTTDEKVVLVSNYTSTMDVLAGLLTSLGYKYLRLDGSTPPAKRQDLVDRFNRSPPNNSFVFLLSAKAGGTGLNLIGASRLVLYDLDWNPATDLQAMARVHRDGQKRPCFIYRLVTQGALEEKIFQRQISKTGLADSIVDGKNGVSGFSPEELRDLFRLDESDDCQTHKLLSCPCGGRGMPALDPCEDIAPERNDLASLNDASTDNDIEYVNMADDDAPPPTQNRFVKGSQWDVEKQEAAFRKARECKDSDGNTKMLSLMMYTHFDTALADEATPDASMIGSPVDGEEDKVLVPKRSLVDDAIEDVALRKVIQEDGRRIGFVFTKMSS